MPKQPFTDSHPAPRKRLRLLVLAVCLFGGPLLVEGIMRFLLFHPSDLAREYGEGLRDAALFADPHLEDEYWLLRWKLEGVRERPPPPPHDAILGWRNRDIEATTYRHRDDTGEDQRRPVLLYGASFAQGFDKQWIEDSELAKDYCFLNYGVGGYGADQAYLLMRESLQLYLDRDPIVIIGLVADSDFNRCALRIRGHPKPRLRLQDGLLESDGPVPPGGTTAYLKHSGVGIASYAWAYLLRSGGILPAAWRSELSGRQSLSEARNALQRRIVLAFQRDLEDADLTHFFLVFSSPHSLPPRTLGAMEQDMVRIFDEAGTPYLLQREYLLDAAASTDMELSSFFVPDGPRMNHPSRLGNRLILRSMIDGISGRFDRFDRAAQPGSGL